MFFVNLALNIIDCFSFVSLGGDTKNGRSLLSGVGEAPWSSGRALALHAVRPRSIPGPGGENY